MSKYSVIKSELKKLAVEIHETKKAFKDSQRNGTWRVTEELRSKCSSLSWGFRHDHIAYSMLRGRTYEQIEAKVAKGNEPNMELVMEIMEDLRSKVIEVANETVCSGS
jgi:hypothetical protein